MREENKLIAEFMGKEWHKSFFKDVFIISPSNITYKFHESWDWLMPVVEKCKEYNNKRLMSNIEKRLLNVDLLGVYKNVIEFIKHERRNNKS